MWKPAGLCITARTIPTVPPRRNLRGQDLERRQARRFSRGATEEVRIRHQSEGRQADWTDDSAERAGEGGQSHQMKHFFFLSVIHFRFSILDFGLAGD